MRGIGRYLKHLQSGLSTLTVQSALQGLGDILRVMTETHAFVGSRGPLPGFARGRPQQQKRSARNQTPDQLVDLGVGLMAGADILGKRAEITLTISPAKGPDDAVFTTHNGKSAETLYKHLIESMLDFAELRTGPSGIAPRLAGDDNRVCSRRFAPPPIAPAARTA